MAFNRDDAAESYAMVAEAMGVREKGMDELGAAGAAVVEMGVFLRRIGHPLRLSEAGVKEEDLVKAAALSLSDGAIVNNARPVLSEEEVLAVYREAF
jgi:alcohol dehydrogenase class IV